MILFKVDQPVGTGFSFSQKVTITTSPAAATDFILFLDNFYSIFTDLRPKKLFLTGESYAGTYIPFITQSILARNANTATSSSSTATAAAAATQKINLRGISFGNPWLDELNQTMTYLKYAQMKNIVTSGVAADVTKYMKGCPADMKKQAYGDGKMKNRKRRKKRRG